MKLFKLTLVALLLVSISSCMKKDNTPPFDFEARLEEEKVIIANNLDEHFSNPIEDELKRGFWYEILEEGDPESYEYRINNVNHIIWPTVRVNYKVFLLDGTLIDETKNEEGKPEGNEFLLRPMTEANPGLIHAWVIAFMPKEIQGQDIAYLTGLTEEGLKVGSVIRFVTPSIYAYQNRATTNIPANSPLVFEIEVLSISNSI